MSMTTNAASTGAPKAQNDPRRQRAEAGVQAHLWLCACMQFAQMWIYSSVVLRESVGSATWWAVALGLVGGLGAWLPTVLLDRLYPPNDNGNGLCGALFGALGRWGGGALCLWLGAVLFLDALICLRALTNLCSEYLVTEVGGRTAGMATVAALAAMLWLGETTGASRVAYQNRLRLAIGFLLVAVVLLPNGRVSNLYPLAWHGVGPSAGLGLLSGNAFCSMFVVGLIAPLTKGAPHTPPRRGVQALLGADLLIVVLQLAFSLVRANSTMYYGNTWAVRLMGSPNYLEDWAAMRMALLLLQTMLLAVSTHGALAYSQHTMAQICPGLSRRWIQGLLCTLLLASVLYSAPVQERLLAHWMPWRLPAVLAPLWLACGVGALRKKSLSQKEAGA
jgi:hypothetical protein